MMRTLRDLLDDFPESSTGSIAHILQTLPAEARGVLQYVERCVSGSQPRAQGPCGNIQEWVETCVAFERGRRYLGIPDVCLPCPLPPSVDYVAELAYCSPKLFSSYCEDLLLLIMYGAPSSQLDRSSHLSLLKWRSPEAESAWAEPMQLPSACLLPSSQPRKELVPHADQGVHWDSRLSSVLQQAGRSLPWFHRSGHSGIVLAGGAAVSMVVRGAPPSDHDLFLVVPSVDTSGTPLSREQRSAAGWSLVQEVLESLRREVAMADRSLHLYVSSWQGVLDVLVLRRPLADATDEVLSGRSAVFKGQIIPRLYESPAQVVHGFDVDACGVLYDGDEVWATSRAVRAMHQGFLLAEPIRQSPSYELRLEKYARRLGLSILVPGMHPMLNEQVVENIAKIKSSVLDSVAWMARLGSSDARIQYANTRGLYQRLRKYNQKQSGLARLITLRMAAEDGLSVKMLCERENNYSWGADSSLDPQQDTVVVKALVGMLFCQCTTELNSGTTDADYENLHREISFITTTPHLQAGMEPLFTGSFRHLPLNNWYHSAVTRAHERFMQGSVDLEASARMWEHNGGRRMERVPTQPAGCKLRAAQAPAAAGSPAGPSGLRRANSDTAAGRVGAWAGPGSGGRAGGGPRDPLAAVWQGMLAASGGGQQPQQAAQQGQQQQAGDAAAAAAVAGALSGWTPRGTPGVVPGSVGAAGGGGLYDALLYGGAGGAGGMDGLGMPYFLPPPLPVPPPPFAPPPGTGAAAAAPPPLFPPGGLPPHLGLLGAAPPPPTGLSSFPSPPYPAAFLAAQTSLLMSRVLLSDLMSLGMDLPLITQQAVGGTGSGAAGTAGSPLRASPLGLSGGAAAATAGLGMETGSAAAYAASERLAANLTCVLESMKNIERVIHAAHAQSLGAGVAQQQQHGRPYLRAPVAAAAAAGPGASGPGDGSRQGRGRERVKGVLVVGASVAAGLLLGRVLPRKT